MHSIGIKIIIVDYNSVIFTFSVINFNCYFRNELGPRKLWEINIGALASNQTVIATALIIVQ